MEHKILANKPPCEFCDVSDYHGKELPKIRNIDGGKQNFELTVSHDPEDECFTLIVDGTFTDVRIEIEFCPKCGRRLIFNWEEANV